MRNDPRQQHDDEQNERAARFKKLQVFRRNGQIGHRPPTEPAKQVTEDIKVEIESAHDGADEVFRLLEPLEPADQPVAE